MSAVLILRLGRVLLLSAITSALLGAQSFLNLSFENASGGVPAGWSSYSTASSYQFAIDTTTAFDGAQSLRISSPSATANQNGIEYLYLPADRAVGKTFHLSGYIRTQTINGYATLWASANGPTYQIASRDLGPAAPRGATGWQRFDLYLPVPAGAVYLDFGAVLDGSGTAWFDNLGIDLNGQPFFSSPTAQQIQWLQANAIPFTSLDPDAGFAELEPLKNIIGNARIVGLGEATHGTSEIWRMKTRLLSFLVQEMGFTILAMEAQMPEAARLNDYIQTGIGRPRELLKGMNYFNWNMQEILDMVEWMRQYNASGKGRIQYMGVDANMANVAIANVMAFVRKADPGLLPSVESSYALVGPLQLPGGWAPDLSRDQAGLAAAQSALGQLVANRERYLREMPATEVDWAIQNATIAVQAVQVSVGNITGDNVLSRDAAMAANTQWIVAHAPPGSRIVLWMHNGHINKAPDTTGGILAQQLGSDYVALGTAFHSGMYFACAPLGSGCPGAPPGVMGDFPALDSFPGSAEYFFHQTGTPRQILNLRLADANDPASSWLMSQLEFRSIGFAQVDGFSEFIPTSRLHQDFDALVFFDQTTAATELPNGPMDLTVLAPVAPLRGSLDVPYLQAPATGVGEPVSLPDGRVGVAYQQVLEAGGGVCSAWPNTTPLDCPAGVWQRYGNWTVIQGALPAGLTLSADGVVSGTPTQCGSFAFTVQVADSVHPETALGRLSLAIPAPSRRGRRPAHPDRPNLPCPVISTLGFL